METFNGLFDEFDSKNNIVVSKSKQSTTVKSKRLKQKETIIKLQDQINLTNSSLFESEKDREAVNELIKKAENVKVASEDVEQILKSKEISIEERLEAINKKVIEVLGKQKNNIAVIKKKEDFTNYITSAINSKIIAVDTETNNSLDPVTCKIMGLCLYYPEGKQAYIPINHRDPQTKERLSWQLTENDIKEELQRIIDSHIIIVMHNGKFDYEVLKCTCNIKLNPTWDTMVAARLLNENELAGLKWQYINKIDKSQEKYDIENLFENINYADVDPDIFAYYAATDARMTYKLYEVQKVEFDKPEYGPHLDMSGKNEIKGLRWLFNNVEMPIVTITAEMELAGVKIDTEYGARLKTKYDKKLLDLDAKIEELLKNIQPYIKAWRLTPLANEKTRSYVPKKSKMAKEKIEAQYPFIDEDGNRYKIGKTKTEQLEDPIKLTSPVQLAILFYDILEVPTIADNSRKTGKDELKSIKEKLAEYLPKLDEINTELDEEDLEEEAEEAIQLGTDQTKNLKLGTAAKLSDLMLQRRVIEKLITSFLDVIPDLAKHWPDGRIRFHMNSLGTDTGRYSSGGKLKFMVNEIPKIVNGINIQQMPSHNPEVRLLFVGDTLYHKVEETDDYFIIPETDEVETIGGWKPVSELIVGDQLKSENTPCLISAISKQKNLYYLYCN